MIAGTELAEVFGAAARGDDAAWCRLVRASAPAIRGVAARHRLSRADQDDVVQQTWIALLQNITRVREPVAVGAWLMTAARRESLRVLRKGRAEVPVSDVEPDGRAHVPDALEGLVAAERRDAVRAAVGRLDGRQRALMQALLCDEPRDYDTLGKMLDMPRGSIGPTRARSLSRLRREPPITALLDSAPPSRTTRPPRPEPELF